MLVDVPCVGITDPINEIVMDQIANCVGLVYVINCTKDNDFEVNKVSTAKIVTLKKTASMYLLFARFMVTELC